MRYCSDNFDIDAVLKKPCIDIDLCDSENEPQRIKQNLQDYEHEVVAVKANAEEKSNEGGEDEESVASAGVVMREDEKKECEADKVCETGMSADDSEDEESEEEEQSVVEEIKTRLGIPYSSVSTVYYKK